MSVFEFGEYWDTGTFLLILVVGILICYWIWQANICSRTMVIRKTGGDIHINQYYVMIFLLLLFIYTFKDISFGADTDYYVKTFLASTDYHNDWNQGLEPLYIGFNYIVRKFTSNYTVYFFVAGVFIVSGYIKFIKCFWEKDCESLFAILIATQFFYDMNIMRSAMACTFLMYSFCALKEQYIKKAFLYTVMGVFFQTTVIVNIPFLLFYWVIRKNDKIRIMKVIFIFSLALVGTTIVTVIARMLFVGTRYEYYFSDGGMQPTLLGNWPIILTGILAIFVLGYRKKNSEKIDIIILAALFSALLIVPVIILGAYRLTMYYYMPRLVLWGYVFKNYIANDAGNKRIKKGIAFAIVLFYALYVISRRSSTYGFAYSLVESIFK